MSSPPDEAAAGEQIAAFEADLAVGSNLATHDARASVRDRYLGRKNGVVASWMQLVLAAAPPEHKTEHRPVRQRAGSRPSKHDGRPTPSKSSARARPADAVDVTLPGRASRFSAAPASAHRRPRAHGSDLRAHGVRRRRSGRRSRTRWHCFDALNMPARTSRPRHAGHALPRARRSRGESGRPDDLRTLLSTHTSSMQIRYMQAARTARADHRARARLSSRRSRL